MTDVEDLIHSFIGSEKKAKLRYQAMCWMRRLFAGVLLPTSLGSIYYSMSFQAIHWATFGITLLLGVWGLVSWLRDWGDERMFLTSLR